MCHDESAEARPTPAPDAAALNCFARVAASRPTRWYLPALHPPPLETPRTNRPARRFRASMSSTLDRPQQERSVRAVPGLRGLGGLRPTEGERSAEAARAARACGPSCSFGRSPGTFQGSKRDRLDSNPEIPPGSAEAGCTASEDAFRVRAHAFFRSPTDSVTLLGATGRWVEGFLEAQSQKANRRRSRHNASQHLHTAGVPGRRLLGRQRLDVCSLRRDGPDEDVDRGGSHQRRRCPL